ncbi:MAG TPA: DNA mismatch repair protein MutS, partial [Nitrospiraceae bacterium]
MTSEADGSPLMRQYREIKRGYPEAILFFRVGDFYEMFHEDAQEASKLLSIALTSRDKSNANPIALCGVPYHASQGYIAKLLQAGRTVAVCEQVEDPKTAKGLVRREVVRVYTPGTLIDTELLSPCRSNFLAAISVGSSSSIKAYPLIGLAYLDVSTGEFWVMEFDGPQSTAHCLDELARLEPRELLYDARVPVHARTWLSQFDGGRLCEQPSVSFDQADTHQLLERHFSVPSLDSLGCRGLSVGIGAAGAVLRYFRQTQPNASLEHIHPLKRRWPKDAMHLDTVTIRNLELVHSLGSDDRSSAQKNTTVLSVLDRTVTAMGSRLLREWLLRPLVDCCAIEPRLEAVGELKERLQERVALRSALRSVQDIARLSSRLTLGVATPRELLALKQSLDALPELVSHLQSSDASMLAQLRDSWDDCSDVRQRIEEAISEEAPLSARDGGIIRAGYHAGVDELRKASTEGKSWIASLEAKERSR